MSHIVVIKTSHDTMPCLRYNNELTLFPSRITRLSMFYKQDAPLICGHVLLHILTIITQTKHFHMQ